jgi:cytosine permease
MPGSASGSQPNEHQGILEAEFEHEPVPMSHRQSLRQVAAVWFGFPMVITNAVFGGIIAYSLGLWGALGAMVLGNLILLAYVGSLSYIAGERGVNFALQAESTFGTWGRRLASAFLATIVVGWYAFQTGLTGTTINTSFGWNEAAVTVVAIILYTGVTFIGIRALSILGMVAAPFYILLGLVALGLLSADHGLGGLTSFRGTGAMTFGGAVTLVVAAFADSGTMTADFTRWSRNGREALYATFTAFPVANLLAQIFGIIIVCAGAAAAPATAGGDFTPVLIEHGGILVALAVIFIFINLGSVCTHCLYNGAVGWSNLTGSTMRTLTIILGILGGIAALAGVWSFFLGWLNLLGIFVPPIGTVLIADQLIFRNPVVEAAVKPFEIDALIAWAIGSAAAIIVHFGVPQFSEAVAGMIVSLAAYAVLSPVIGRRKSPQVEMPLPRR